jgi:tyrosyl-tRNA synthetase
MDPTEVKMSKSKPDSMISIHDTPDSVKNKLKKAYCPEKTVEGNPVLEICKYVIFPELQSELFMIKRSEKFGGNQEYQSYEELEQAFVKGLHPLDLKNATAEYINRILEPVHQFFNKNSKNLDEMKKIGLIND